MRIMITGGAGFIGSAVVRYILANTHDSVLVIDSLTYAGNLLSLASVGSHKNLAFSKINICDRIAVDEAFNTFKPDAVMHLAAETHVDRSIDSPATFIETNIVGTYTLLESARHYWSALPGTRQETFRFHHISTDEVYGDLAADDSPFEETTPYAPSSPYSASKASSDHLVRAWQRTYQMPVLITNCSNNYGPFQFPEKLIPLTVINALAGKPLPVYGEGLQIRDWLYVEDHAQGLYQVLTRGRIGETYNIGGHNELRNIDVVRTICSILNKTLSAKPAKIENFEQLITFVTDRPGHDKRYAINANKIEQEIGWRPQESFASGIHKTIKWYLLNDSWVQSVQNGSYQGQRLGLTGQGIKP